MAINYEWNVNTVDTYPTKDSKSDVVYNVHWRLRATDDENNIEDSFGSIRPATAEVYGTQLLDVSDLSSFTAFADLTASDVQGWVEAAMGEEAVTNYKADLDAQIAEQITPTSVTKTIG